MSIIEGNSENFETEVIKADGPVLVDFNATWCPPCRALEPTLEELGEEGYKIVSVDVDAEAALAAEFGVSSIPCLVFFRGGVEYDRRVGLQPKKRLIKILEAQ